MVLILVVWFVAAAIVGATGALAWLPVPPPVILWTLTAAALLTLWRSAGARAATRAVGTRTLVAFHLVRLPAGINFLRLNESGALPEEFALVAGWGDIAVGIAALLVLALAVPVRTPARRYALLAWNTFGLADILVVVGNAMRLFLSDPDLATPFVSLPMALLPTFVVPIVITTHIVLYGWYARRGNLDEHGAA
jgi:hypothetical protein